MEAIVAFLEMLKIFFARVKKGNHFSDETKILKKIDVSLL